MNSYRQSLIEEINFWRELFSDSSLSIGSPEYQRASYALQLAEQKLSRHEHLLTTQENDSFMH